MIFQVGVTGFNHREWRGDFYPSVLGERDMLAYYANRFGAVEIETSFLRMPSLTTVDRWVYETPDNFRFSLQVPRRITHQAPQRYCRAGSGSAQIDQTNGP